MLRTARAPVGVLVVGGAALILPPQTRDMLAFLDDGHVWGAASFQISLIVLGLGAWYWSRAALAARFGIPDGVRDEAGLAERIPDFGWTAFVWVPRLTVAVSVLIGVAMAWENGNPLTALAAIIIGIIAVVFTVKRPRAGTQADPAARQFALIRVWHAPSRFAALLAHAPFGARFALGLLLFSLLPFAVGLIDSFAVPLQAPNRLAVLFPGPGIVLLLLGLSIGPLTCLTFVSDGMCWQLIWRGLTLGPRRPPVLTLFAAYTFILVPYFYQRLHVVRTVAPMERRADLSKLFSAWVNACAPNATVIRPVIMDMSGGATRAALWGAAVLDRVLAARGPDGPALFAISSVSGGSLGAAAAVSMLRQEARPCTAPNLAALRPRGGRAPLAGDALGPLLGGWLMDDTPRAIFTPIAEPLRRAMKIAAYGGDSAEIIEQAFADLWSDVPAARGAPGWNTSFLSLFYDAGTMPGEAKYAAGMPIWLANGTDATTGNRVLTSPIDPPLNNDAGQPAWPFGGARDFTALTKNDVRVATAINNTARFPYLEPFGNMFGPVAEDVTRAAPAGNKQDRVAALIDGGYFENEGIQTALELAHWLEQQHPGGKTVEPIIVQATSDGVSKTTAAQVMHCGHPSDGPWVWSHEKALSQFLAPLVGLTHVRGGHSAVLLRQAFDKYCGTPQRFFNFYLPGDKGSDIPLNWVLSYRTADFIWNGAFTSNQVDNAGQLKALGETMTTK